MPRAASQPKTSPICGGSCSPRLPIGTSVVIDAYGCTSRETSWGLSAILPPAQVKDLLSHERSAQVCTEQGFPFLIPNLYVRNSRHVERRVSLWPHHTVGLCRPRFGFYG